MTQTTKITPWIDGHPLADGGEIVLHRDDEEGADDRPEHGAEAADAGSSARPHPTWSSATSVSEASWNTSALVAPATPAKAADSTKATQLVAIDVVAERNRARLVLADRLEHLAEGRVDDAIDQQEADEKDHQHE